MGPLEQKLERVAARVGWRLRWKREALRAYPRMSCTELDIYEGKRLVTANGAIAVLHGGVDSDARARETVARMVLTQLPSRGAGQR